MGNYSQARRMSPSRGGCRKTYKSDAERLRRLGDVALGDEDDGGELAADSERVGRLDVDARLGDLLEHAVVVAELVRVLHPERSLGLGRLAQLGKFLLRPIGVGGEEV